MTARSRILELKERMSRSIIGQEHIVERLLMGLLANGNLLVEGLPGLAKTRAVKSLAKNLEAEMDRFLMHIYIDYPDTESEVEVARLVRGPWRTTVCAIA